MTSSLLSFPMATPTLGSAVPGWKLVTKWLAAFYFWCLHASQLKIVEWILNKSSHSKCESTRHTVLEWVRGGIVSSIFLQRQLQLRNVKDKTDNPQTWTVTKKHPMRKYQTYLRGFSQHKPCVQSSTVNHHIQFLRLNFELLSVHVQYDRWVGHSHCIFYFLTKVATAQKCQRQKW